MNTFDLEIVTAETQIFSGVATKLLVTGVEGELEILARHAPFLTEIAPGPVWFADESGNEEGLVLFGGVLEVQPKKTIILGNTAVRSQEMDEQDAIAAKQRAEESMADKSGEVDYQKAHADLMIAMAQLRILRRLRKK